MYKYSVAVGLYDGTWVTCNFDTEHEVTMEAEFIPLLPKDLRDSNIAFVHVLYSNPGN